MAVSACHIYMLEVPYLMPNISYLNSSIIATAFIHLLDPAIEELGNPCLTGEWTVYPWAIAIGE